MGWKAAAETDTIGEQQLKWTQAESSSRNHGAAAEADAIREHAAAEMDEIAAALHRELSGAGLLMYLNEGEVPYTWKFSL